MRRRSRRAPRFQSGKSLDRNRTPSRVVTGQVGVDGSVRKRDQRAIPTVSALDSRLLAHSGTPFVRTCRCVTRLARCLTLPAHGVDIRATPKPLTKECHFRLGGESRRFGFGRRGCRSGARRHSIPFASRSAINRSFSACSTAKGIRVHVDRLLGSVLPEAVIAAVSDLGASAAPDTALHAIPR